VGVVGNVRHTGITTDPEPAIYVPFQQMPSNGMWVMIHTSGDPTTLAQPVTAAVHAINPLQPVAEMRPLSSVPAAALARPRLVMLLLTGFAAAALFLAALGIYGTISYSVAQRAREMGIRMALGARGRDVVALVVREGMVMVAGGLAAGVVVALAGSRVMRGILAGVGATDAVTYAAVSGFLVLIALLACWIPARRAGGVDPIVSLKND
jgi:ABC-type antimicrobial peptide transport system permease subunit